MCDQSKQSDKHKEPHTIFEGDGLVEDEDICLPADTLAILNEFLQERYESQTETVSNGKTPTKIEEDWVRSVST